MTNQDEKGRRVIPSIRRLADKQITTAELKDRSGNAIVMMSWHMNKKAKEDQVFSLSINGETAFLSLDELLAYTRML